MAIAPNSYLAALTRHICEPKVQVQTSCTAEPVAKLRKKTILREDRNTKKHRAQLKGHKLARSHTLMLRVDVCAHWKNKCAVGESCRFLHIALNGSEIEQLTQNARHMIQKIKTFDAKTQELILDQWVPNTISQLPDYTVLETLMKNLDRKIDARPTDSLHIVNNRRHRNSIYDEDPNDTDNSRGLSQTDLPNSLVASEDGAPELTPESEHSELPVNLSEAVSPVDSPRVYPAPVTVPTTVPMSGSGYPLHDNITHSPSEGLASSSGYPQSPTYPNQSSYYPQAYQPYGNHQRPYNYPQQMYQSQDAQAFYGSYEQYYQSQDIETLYHNYPEYYDSNYPPKPYGYNPYYYNTRRGQP